MSSPKPPPSAIATLPPEILETIFTHADRPTLAQVCKASKVSRALSERVLYRHVPYLPAKRVVLYLRTVVRRPALANHTRSLVICDAVKASCFEQPLEEEEDEAFTLFLPSFFILINRALSVMPRLTELSLILRGSRSEVIFKGWCPYRLRRITTTLTWDKPFARWLIVHKPLVAALLCGPHTRGVEIPRDALPNLRRVSASPLILGDIVPGRPVTEVELCLNRMDLLTEEVMASALTLISYSTGPVKSLHVISHFTGVVDQVLKAISAIPVVMPDIKSLILNAVLGGISSDVVAGLQPILSNFKFLDTVILHSHCLTDGIHSTDAINLPSKWHAVLPTLRYVTLPGKTWLRHSSYGWVTMDELERIVAMNELKLLERERIILEREKELQTNRVLLKKQEAELERLIAERDARMKAASSAAP